jgi:hypothetical protein
MHHGHGGHRDHGGGHESGQQMQDRQEHR